jgi:hypothetical protein
MSPTLFNVTELEWALYGNHGCNVVGCQYRRGQASSFGDYSIRAGPIEELYRTATLDKCSAKMDLHESRQQPFAAVATDQRQPVAEMRTKPNPNHVAKTKIERWPGNIRIIVTARSGCVALESFPGWLLNESQESDAGAADSRANLSTPNIIRYDVTKINRVNRNSRRIFEIDVRQHSLSILRSEYGIQIFDCNTPQYCLEALLCHRRLDQFTLGIRNHCEDRPHWDLSEVHIDVVLLQAIF